MSEPRAQQWRAIKDWPGYEIADFPDYKRKKKHKHGKQVRKKATHANVSIRMCPRGYRLVDLWRDKKKKTLKVAILVATAFVPNPNNYPEVDHKEGDPDDDDATRLQWVTRSQNIQNTRKKSRSRGGSLPTSKYKGVSWKTSKRRWVAVIQVEIDGKRKQLFLGYFKKESDARKAYDAASIKHHTNGRTNVMLFKPEDLAKWDAEEREKMEKDDQGSSGEDSSTDEEEEEEDSEDDLAESQSSKRQRV